jgi:cell division transport system ATP-binding protein
MIRLSQVGKRYGDRDALRGVDLELPKGSLNFLMGPSGAGKSTLLRLLLALERPDAGQVEVAGLNLGTLPRRQRPAYLRRVGAVFQDPQLLADRTVYQNVALPLQLAGYPEPAQGPRVRAALGQVGLAGAEGRLPRALSTGERQRVGIARALVHRPALVLADEPTGNLDPALSAEIMGLFQRFQQVGVTVVIATHDVDLVQRFSGQALHLEGGRLVGRAALGGAS